ncbi:hypothetical protein Tco_1273755 [Tanacetum coccineum]|uniref:Uncharacterized protein n=1 Tax=Tanacetum coccineum TaxID=301880 RepID=A0ABQ5DUC9_9ASTR
MATNIITRLLTKATDNGCNGFKMEAMKRHLKQFLRITTQIHACDISCQKVHQRNGEEIEDIYAIKKAESKSVNNPQKLATKVIEEGGTKKNWNGNSNEAKAYKCFGKCRYCAEITNKHTKTTCPLNPKYIAKLARTKAAAEQERRIAASATEQEDRNSDKQHT